MEKWGVLSIVKEEKIEPIKLNAMKIYYSKKDVESIAEKMKECKEKYCLSSEINDICGVFVRDPKVTFSPILTNAIMRYAFKTTAKFVFLREEVQEYKNKIDMKDKMNRIFSEENPIKGFEKILTLKGISFSENSQYTAQEWFAYCKEKMMLSERSKKT
ncbi:hypothetical protein [Bacillus cereus]|uniref:hypothetical protein n=1 Tax=Bacillus cereus TaxID=1396 RepID=UPI001F2F806B|nr:hypothetical protein [Bacillus cereus]BCC00635.1 hypothetical protein BCM0057_2717 [Bacillus cereus]BCD16937.1 hypothetical protein BC30077_1713 [Bacillus cereus]BCD18734.1 hypothetical protein BC30077_3510 [Bacillus cereus]